MDMKIDDQKQPRLLIFIAHIFYHLFDEWETFLYIQTEMTSQALDA